MSKRSLIALIIICLLWILVLCFAVIAFRITKGYSVFALILMPITLLIYLGNYYDSDEEEKNLKKNREKK